MKCRNTGSKSQVNQSERAPSNPRVEPLKDMQSFCIFERREWHFSLLQQSRALLQNFQTMAVWCWQHPPELSCNVTPLGRCSPFGSCTFVSVGVLVVSRWGQKSALMIKKPNVTPVVPDPQSVVHNQNYFDGGLSTPSHQLIYNHSYTMTADMLFVLLAHIL